VDHHGDLGGGIFWVKNKEVFLRGGIRERVQVEFFGRDFIVIIFVNKFFEFYSCCFRILHE
jgi:hypothetical protein